MAARVAGGVTAVAAVVLGAVGPYLLQLLYGDAFLDAAAPLRLLLAETVIGCVSGVLQQALNGTGRPGAVSVIEMASVAVGIAMLLLLLPRHGTVGAACAVVAASGVRLLGVMLAVRILLKERMPRLVPNLADLRLALQR
jgi:O-antigen/teichoic acid export membrane protein